MGGQEAKTKDESRYINRIMGCFHSDEMCTNINQVKIITEIYICM